MPETLRLDVISLAAGSWAPAERVWQHVFERVPGASPFLSPLWTSTFVREFGATVAAELLVCFGSHDEPLGVCLLSRRTRRSTVLPFVRAFLNTDGEPAHDNLVIEHNAVLAVPGAESAVLHTLARYVQHSRVDEFVLSGVAEADVARLSDAFPRWRVDVEYRECPYVDLDKLRAAGGEHLRVLSKNSREQLKRSMTQYRARGPLVLEAARSAEEGESMFNELIALHEAHWRGRGQPGTFESERRRRFHREYVRAGVPTGAAQLFRVSVGGEPIAVLYNIVANGRVNFYQSGIRYEEDKHLKPGVVSHHLAIQHCLAEGLSEYDFLVSGPAEGRYKRSLSDSTRQLAWMQLARPGWRTAYFNSLRSARQRAAGLRMAVSRSGAAPEPPTP